MLERGEGDQYPAIGKGRHSPLQAFGGPGRRLANTITHLAQFLLSFFWCGIDVFVDGFRSRLFWSHEFILSTSCRDSDGILVYDAPVLLCRIGCHYGAKSETRKLGRRNPVPLQSLSPARLRSY